MVPSTYRCAQTDATSRISRFFLLSDRGAKPMTCHFSPSLKPLGTLLVISALSMGCLMGLAGCASNTSTDTTSKNDTTTLAQKATRLNDRYGSFSPDVTSDYSIPYTIQVEGTTYTDEEGNLVKTADTEYTVDVSIDPYRLLWSATGTITDIDYATDLAAVRLTSVEEGHFSTTDILISYANYLSVSEYDLGIGDNISFQYLLTDPMRNPLQAYSVALA